MNEREPCATRGPCRPKKAGDKITCVKCNGKGYTLEGLTGDYPRECDRCHGTGKQTVKPR